MGASSLKETRQRCGKHHNASGIVQALAEIVQLPLHYHVTPHYFACAGHGYSGSFSFDSAKPSLADIDMTSRSSLRIVLVMVMAFRVRNPQDVSGFISCIATSLTLLRFDIRQHQILTSLRGRRDIPSSFSSSPASV